MIERSTSSSADTLLYFLVEFYAGFREAISDQDFLDLVAMVPL